MNAFFVWIGGLLAAYLWGSIPYGFLIARAKGVDIRTVGSRNIGATNVFRCVGKGPGLLTFALDLFKGFCGAKLLPALLSQLAGSTVNSDLAFQLACGAATVIGHNWTCFLGFRGGKGIASSLGLLIGLAPAGAGIAGIVWLVVFLAARFVSLASIVAAASLGVSTWWLYYPQKPAWFSLALTALAGLAILKHRANIGRLLNGTESRFSFSKKTTA